MRNIFAALAVAGLLAATSFVPSAAAQSGYGYGYGTGYYSDDEKFSKKRKK